MIPPISLQLKNNSFFYHLRTRACSILYEPFPIFRSHSVHTFSLPGFYEKGTEISSFSFWHHFVVSWTSILPTPQNCEAAVLLETENMFHSIEREYTLIHSWLIKTQSAEFSIFVLVFNNDKIPVMNWCSISGSLFHSTSFLVFSWVSDKTCVCFSCIYSNSLFLSDTCRHRQRIASIIFNMHLVHQKTF